MENLNDKVTKSFCEICGCNIKNKDKHINTKKHKKELQETNDLLNKAKRMHEAVDKFKCDSTLNFHQNLANFILNG